MTLFGGAPSGFDPFAITEYPEIGGPSFQNTAGRVLASPQGLVGGETTLVFIALGQSNIANSLQSAYVSSHSTKVQQLNPFNGLIYEWAEPMLGATGSTGAWLGRLGDKLIDAGVCQRVIFVSIAVGGSSIARWAPRGIFSHRLPVAIRWCRKLALPISGKLLVQGETDNDLNTTGSFYEARLRELIDTSRGVQDNSPWFISQTSYVSAGNPSNAGIRAAQAAVVDNVGVFHLMDTDTVGSSFRFDGTHYNNAGADAVADLAKTGLVNSGLF